jgi:hypothetical protein
MKLEYVLPTVFGIVVIGVILTYGLITGISGKKVIVINTNDLIYVGNQNYHDLLDVSKISDDFLLVEYVIPAHAIWNNDEAKVVDDKIVGYSIVSVK